MPNLNAVSGAGVNLTTTNGDTTTAATFATRNDKLYLLVVKILAINTGSYADAAGYVRTATFLNDGGVLSQVGAGVAVSSQESGDAGAWNVDISPSGTDILVRVAGQPAKTIKWRVAADIEEL